MQTSAAGTMGTVEKGTPGRTPKVCLVTRFFDLRNAGIGRFSMEMLAGLKKRGYDTVPISTDRPGNAGYFWYTACELRRRIPRGCDVYHCLSPAEAIHAPKASTVVSFHDLIPWLHIRKMDTHYAQGTLKEMKRLVSKQYFAFAARAAAKCRVIASNSDHTRKELIEHLNIDGDRVVVVRLGIARGLQPGPKKDAVFRVGTLSFLDRRKRIDLLIQGFLAADVDGELVIGGSGVDRARLAALAGNDPRVKFLGFVPEEKMADFYNSLDLFVFPTRIEGYGLPIVEAFACRKPVVVLEDGIIPDEIKSRCLVTDDLTGFLKDPATLPGGAIEDNYRFARLHDWDSCVEQYISLYDRVLEAT